MRIEELEAAVAHQEQLGLKHMTLVIHRPNPPQGLRARVVGMGFGEVLNAQEHPAGGWNIVCGFAITQVREYIRKYRAQPGKDFRP